MGNMAQEGTIMDFDIEARKTIVAEIIMRLEREILDLRDALQADIPEMLNDRWIPIAEASAKVVNVSESHGREMAKLLGWLKDANYGTMEYDVAECLFSPKDYEW